MPLKKCMECCRSLHWLEFADSNRYEDGLSAICIDCTEKINRRAKKYKEEEEAKIKRC